VFGKQGVGPLGPRVRLPRRLLQDAADRLAVQIHVPSDLRLGTSLNVEQPVDLPPAVLSDHAPLPEWYDLGGSVAVRGRRTGQQCLAHRYAFLCQEGWGNFHDHKWDYWMTADIRGAPQRGLA
jgi:hypothetical protein